ncbi:MAG: hypothetical protein M3004_01480 [Bacteroidota bacterium]|nr:hypothetical protein [Bacteroidota bacterium]
MKKITLFLLIIFSISSQIFAQDKIYRKNGQVVKAKIIEIGTSEIKYKLPDNPESPIYVLEKDNINKIEYEDGRVEKFATNLKDPEKYIGQLHKAIKVDFLGPLIGYSQISFEKSTGVGKGYEITLGIIGAGKNQRVDYYYNNVQLQKRNQFGFSTSVGYKFNKWPDFLFGRTRLTHIMQGAYAKPIIYVGSYKEDRLILKGNYQYVVERPSITFAALQIEFGKQWVFGEKFLIDIYTGYGYGFDNKKGDGIFDDNSSAFNYINARGGNSPGLSVTYGIKLGWLIK